MASILKKLDPSTPAMNSEAITESDTNFLQRYKNYCYYNNVVYRQQKSQCHRFWV